ncbi:MAG: acetate--CoA ligase family protein, partial [Ottowia sp.]|nr:acetate--CoA ligase family protein [Ottowia sp.]
MKIHEYQAKEILRRFGVPVPRGLRAFSAQEAVEAAQKLGGNVWMVKAQIHAGGRGAAGGVQQAHTPQQVGEAAGQLLGTPLVTSETGAAGQPVRRLLVEECVQVRQEFVLELRVSRRAQCITFAARPAQAEGEGAAPVQVEPLAGLTPAQCAQLCEAAAVPAEAAAEFGRICRALYACYLESDALRLLAGPLALDEAGRLLALDAR